MDINQIIAPRGKKPKDLLSLFLGRITKPKAGEEPLTVPVWKTLLGKGVDPLAFKRWFVKFRPYETIQLGAAYGYPTKPSGRPQGEQGVPTGVAGGVITPPTIPSPIREIADIIAPTGPSDYAQPSRTRGETGLYGAGGGAGAAKAREEFVYRGGIYVPTIPTTGATKGAK